MGDWIVGTVIVLVVVAAEAWIFWRYPDFRRAFVAHWRPSAVAKRIDDWCRRNAR